MPRLALVSLLCLSSLWGCATMHAVTGDPLFAPEPKPVIKGPNVPEPEPTDAQFEAELEEARSPAPPAATAPAKKKSSKVAAARK